MCLQMYNMFVIFKRGRSYVFLQTFRSLKYLFIPQRRLTRFIIIEWKILNRFLFSYLFQLQIMSKMRRQFSNLVLRRHCRKHLTKNVIMWMEMPTAIRKKNVLVILFKGCNILYIIEHLFRYAVPFKICLMAEDEISEQML